jgi:hypothetical protein
VRRECGAITYLFVAWRARPGFRRCRCVGRRLVLCAAKVASDAFTTLCKAAKAELPALANAAKAMMIAIGVGVGLGFPAALCRSCSSARFP